MFFPLKDENPTEKKPILTIGLIVINVAIFIYTFFSGNLGGVINEFGMTPKDITHGRDLYTIFSSMFLHGGFLHVIMNVWYLWIFGDNIEDLFGRSKFLLIYFGAGIIASLAHVAFHPESTVRTIGASGAVAGILGAYMVKFPRAKVITLLFIFLFFTLVKIPSFVFLGVWIGLNILNASITTVAGIQVTVAYWAHIGGFIGGVLMALLLRERTSYSRKEITKKYFQGS